jgi:NHL repeat-containing protein
VVAKDPVSGFNSLFVADTESHRIRMIYLEGSNAGKSILLAGDGYAGLYDGGGDAHKAHFRNPRGIAAITDANGVVTTLLVADTDNNIIRKLLPPTSIKWRLSGFSGVGGAGYVDGSSSASQYNYPAGIVVAPDGFIYVADTGNGVIRKLDQFGTSSTLVAPGTIDSPFGITASQSSGLLYVSQYNPYHRVWRVDTSGGATVIAGSTTQGFADGTSTAAQFNWPSHLAWANTASGEVIYIADRYNYRIRKLAISSNAVSTFAGTGTPGFADGSCSTAQFDLPHGVAVGPVGEVYVIDTANNRIRKLQ